MSQTVLPPRVAVHEAPQAATSHLDNRKLGMWLYLATEVMLFAGLIGAFLTAKMHGPMGANHVLNIPVTAANTFVLIVSSTAVVMALSAIEDGNRRRLLVYLVLTWVLGATFLGVQIREYTLLLREGLTPSSSLFGSGFYAVTGFHGFHVFIGLCWVTGLIIETLLGRFTAENHMRIEIFGLYWHFVDIVWIILFTIIYLL
jgi:heme/copper-type cytochrome/quinol oxidase subunit 3